MDLNLDDIDLVKANQELEEIFLACTSDPNGVVKIQCLFDQLETIYGEQIIKAFIEHIENISGSIDVSDTLTMKSFVNMMKNVILSFAESNTSFKSANIDPEELDNMEPTEQNLIEMNKHPENKETSDSHSRLESFELRFRQNIAALEQKLLLSESTNQSLQEKLTSSTNSAIKLTKKLQLSNDEISNLEFRCDELQKQVVTQEAKINHLNTNLTKAILRTEALEQEMSPLEEEISKLKRIVISKTKLLENIQNMNKILCTNNEALKEEKFVSMSKLKEKEAMLIDQQDLFQRIADLTYEKHVLQSQINELQIQGVLNTSNDSLLFNSRQSDTEVSLQSEILMVSPDSVGHKGIICFDNKSMEETMVQVPVPSSETTCDKQLDKENFEHSFSQCLGNQRTSDRLSDIFNSSNLPPVPSTTSTSSTELASSNFAKYIPELDHGKALSDQAIPVEPDCELSFPPVGHDSESLYSSTTTMPCENLKDENTFNKLPNTNNNCKSSFQSHGCIRDSNALCCTAYYSHKGDLNLSVDPVYNKIVRLRNYLSLVYKLMTLLLFKWVIWIFKCMWGLVKSSFKVFIIILIVLYFFLFMSSIGSANMFPILCFNSVKRFLSLFFSLEERQFIWFQITYPNGPPPV